MTEMQTKLVELKARLEEVRALNNVQSVLSWDQSTQMPLGGGAARAKQLAVLAQVTQEKAIDPGLGRLLDALQKYGEGLPYDSDDASLIRVARRDYERDVKVPAEFVARFSAHSAESYQAWTQARPENNFDRVRPVLEKTLDLSREFANYFPGYEHIADPLIDLSDYGMRAASICTLFTELRARMVPIVQAITSQPVADDTCLKQSFPEPEQIAFGRKVVERLGFDFQRGRQDKSPHPFTTSFSVGDVRITTRVQERDLGDCLFSMIHEGGHAMYEQGVDPAYDGTPLMGGTSSGVHESQSRLWENVVGRSRGFWEYFYPELKKTFPNLNQVSLDTFYRAINKVERSLIRTDADEVTYNLHVMLRFDFELQLLEGKLEVKDLPQAWRERFRSDLGIVPPDHKDGVLQDVHWFSGFVGGAFQGYTLGNILGAQFYAAALQAHPEIPEEMKQGRFEHLHAWLGENLYRHGRKYTAAELVQRATGSAIAIEPYIQYLHSKYGGLYQL